MLKEFSVKRGKVLRKVDHTSIQPRTQAVAGAERRPGIDFSRMRGSLPGNPETPYTICSYNTVYSRIWYSEDM